MNANEWRPIETAPIGKEMFVVMAFRVSPESLNGRSYTTDPYCVWRNTRDLSFARWPHPFPPTHWTPLPPPPTQETQV